MDLNVVIMTGNLTKDPDLRYLPNGSPVCEFRLANKSKLVRAEAGEGYDAKPIFIDVTVYGKRAESCGQYLTKGQRVEVSGRLAFREWTSDDQQRRQKYSVEATVVNFGPKPQGHGMVSQEPVAQEPASPATDEFFDDQVLS